MIDLPDDSPINLRPGTVIAGRYEVVKCLGAGSMGLVYSCKHKELSNHLVAVKVLFPEVSQDKIAAARFRNEIFASYGVSHPNVVRAYEYIRDGNIVAYTMEFVGGGDLADRLGDSSPIPVKDIIKYLTEMCAGVQAIHDAGIVHRDLKPENILLTNEGGVKIADFGIARTGHGPRLTEHGGVVGTIDYVSPEYMLNSQVDSRSDIYAIGILGYEMLTGESPFRGESVYETMTKRLKTDPPPPSTKRKECPAELDAIILRAMNRDPELRYQTAKEMLVDVEMLRSRDSSEGKTPRNLQYKPTVVAEVPQSAPAKESRPDEGTRTFRPGDLFPYASQGGSAESRKKTDTRINIANKFKSMGFGTKPTLGGGTRDFPETINDDRMGRLQTLSEDVERWGKGDVFRLVAAILFGLSLGILSLRALPSEWIELDPSSTSSLLE